MPKLKLTVANAGDHFSADDVNAIRTGVRAAERFIDKHFALDYDIDVIVTAPSYLMPTIPEDRISGRTYNSRLIMLVIDTTQTNASEDFVFETVCHELSHSLRWEKVPDRADTLLKAILFEGVATVLEEVAIEQTKRPSSQFFLDEIRQTDQTTINTIYANLVSMFDDTNYDYGTVFFDGDTSLPRWSGYKLGYDLVRRYMGKNNTDIFHTAMLSYDELATGVYDHN